ncbi:MAG: hypothetical protein EOM92_05715 [Gammaproteobacteria bacterium]|jgi:hypothetical protein|nr:hypothetical protein [Gammaproteobacteria bacterium]
MVRALIASLVIFAVLLGWVWVQQRYATFARRNPRLGPFRSPDDSCGGSCSCKGGQCQVPPR